MTSDTRIKFPSGFWTGVQQMGVPPHEIARKAGLPLTIIHEPMVTSSQYLSIWQAYSDLIGDTSEAIIRLSTGFETVHFPPTVLAAYHARDYRDALTRMVRYKRLCPPEGLLITEDGDECSIELGWMSKDEPGPAVLAGITLAFLLELGRRGTGRPLTAKSVELSCLPGDVQPLEAYFGCRVQTGGNRNTLILHRKDLDLPFASYNAELLEVLTPVLDQSAAEHQSGNSVTEMVKWFLKRSLPGGRAGIEAAAAELGMSNRTLQRRLHEERTSFKHLLTQVRKELAREYLADPSLDIREVAFLIGYEDQNSFYRAFRLWEGDTPSRWRTERLGETP
ncbi:helix-turn-helix domain-containing protein [Halobacillus sp. ACCC02827]|uniref:AraC family transcriptional regulator n=1 Tax=Halobacillus sp. ACCC02827 TaxID=3052090 RepID=UPI00256FAB02|nr:AraC family transcriptional regulator [Halobacillus sp. ACCC02827]WJE17170.1 helix-turn-helix domain-containing protein [Halobacillus sp. ACCC02827]